MNFDKAFPKRVALARSAIGITQAELAKAVGVVQRQIAAYEGGEAKPRINALNNLAAALGTSAEWLANGSGDSPSYQRIRPTVTVPEIPLLSWVEASFFEEYEASSYTSFHRAPDGASDSAFALKIVGDSMLSSNGISFPPGSIVTFEPDIETQSGDFALVRVADSFESSLKQIFFSGDRVNLHSLNPLYPDWHAQKDDLKIIATAIYAEQKLK